MRQWHFRSYLAIFLWCTLAVVLTHLPMLFKPHCEGDEMVYHALSRQMTWGLAHYTTRDDPRVGNFPDKTYRAPLFHQPPLYSLLLKIGSRFDLDPLLWLPNVQTVHITPEALATLRQRQKEGQLQPTPVQLGDDVKVEENGAVWVAVPAEEVAASFLLAVLVMMAALYYTWRLMVSFEMEPVYGAAAMIGLTICPLLLFSTARIHADGLAGLMLLCGLAAFCEALTFGRISPAIQASVWLTAALNTRFNTIIAVPIILVMPAYFAYARRRAITPASPLSAKRPQPVWLISIIVLGTVMTLGMEHFYRLYAVYGTILPSELLHGDVASSGGLLRLVDRMTRSWMLWDLASIFPLAIVILLPWNLAAIWRGLKAGAAPAIFVVIFLIVFGLQLGISYTQMRYFAVVIPLLHLCWPFLLRNTPRGDAVRWNVYGLAALTALLMITTGFLVSAVFAPANGVIVPALRFYWPTMLKAYNG